MRGQEKLRVSFGLQCAWLEEKCKKTVLPPCFLWTVRYRGPPQLLSRALHFRLPPIVNFSFFPDFWLGFTLCPKGVRHLADICLQEFPDGCGSSLLFSFLLPTTYTSLLPLARSKIEYWGRLRFIFHFSDKSCLLNKTEISGSENLRMIVSPLPHSFQRLW